MAHILNVQKRVSVTNIRHIFFFTYEEVSDKKMTNMIKVHGFLV